MKPPAPVAETSDLLKEAFQSLERINARLGALEARQRFKAEQQEAAYERLRQAEKWEANLANPVPLPATPATTCNPHPEAPKVGDTWRVPFLITDPKGQLVKEHTEVWTADRVFPNVSNTGWYIELRSAGTPEASRTLNYHAFLHNHPGAIYLGGPDA